jgi:hypothetical protein
MQVYRGVMAAMEKSEFQVNLQFTIHLRCFRIKFIKIVILAFLVIFLVIDHA